MFRSSKATLALKVLQALQLNLNSRILKLKL